MPSSSTPGLVESALGAVPLSDLGVVLSHEHLFINRLAEFRGAGVLNDEDEMRAEVMGFATAGGSTIFDLTTASLTRGSVNGEGSTSAGAGLLTRDPGNVEAIQRISRATGVNVLLGTGLYRDPYIDAAAVDELGVDGLAAFLVRDIVEGFPGTTAKAALIGEIGADKWYISALEERSFRAAARAHRATGVPIYTHAARWQVGLAELALLREERVDPARIAIGHVDMVVGPEYAMTLLRAGCFVGLDTVEIADEREVSDRVAKIMAIVRAGYLGRILLSHDICAKAHLASRGGHGLGLVTGRLKAALIAAGLSDEEFDQIVTANPVAFLTG